MAASPPARPPWTTTANTSVAPSAIGASRFSTVDRTTIGVTSAAIPSTSVRLATLEPMMLPTPMSNEPWAPASPDTSISGADVPNPMTTAPMRIGDRRSAFATRAAPTTNWSEA
jgi:hypothetical protein